MFPAFEMIASYPSATWLDPLAVSALKATALIAAAAMAATLLRRAPAATRHVVWTLAVLGVLAIPVAARVVPALPVHGMSEWLRAVTPATPSALPKRVTSPASNAILTHAAEPASSGATTTPASGTVLVRAADEAAATIRGTASPVTEFADETRREALAPSAGEKATPPSTPAAPRGMTRDDVLRMLAAVWLVGALFVVGRRLFASWRLSRIGRRATLVSDADWLTRAVRHGRDLGVGRAVTLKISAEVGVPMTWGSLAPTVLLPAEAYEWNAERRSLVLLHELAHVKRLDAFTQLVSQGALALYWFHPLVWMAVRHQRAEAERACDDLVLCAGLKPSTYAGDLLEIARHAGGDERLASAALAMARPSQLEGRLLAILDPRQPRGGAGRWSLAAAVLVATGTLGVIAAVRPAESRLAPLPPEKPAHRASATPRVLATPAVATPAVATPAPEALVAAPDSGAEVNASAATPAPATHSSPTPDVRESAPVAETPTPSPAAQSMTAPQAEATTPGYAFEVTTTSTPAPAPSAPATPAAPAAASSSSKTSNSSFSITEDDGQPKSWNGYSKRPGYEAKFKGKGDIKFTRELTDVQHIGDGGYLTLEERKDGHTYKADFRMHNGRLERRHWRDGHEQAWDGGAQAWLGRFLIDLDRNNAMFVDERYPRMMKEGGPGLVLQEIAILKTDYAKSVYYQRLLGERLDAGMLRRVVAQAGREIGSDHELARALIKAAEKNALDDAGTRAAFLEAVGGLDSDYEHARVLMVLAARKDLSADVANGALQSAARLESDYERSRVLIAMAEHRHVAPAMQREYLRAAGAMKSDYERGRALTALITAGGLTQESVLRLFETTAGIESSYERANVLVKVAETVRMNESARTAFTQAARGIPSKYDRGRAFAALGESVTE